MDCNWIGWCALKPEAQAAWVQAIGSIAAIATAVWLANTQQQRLDRKRLRAIRTILNNAETTAKSDASTVSEMITIGNLSQLSAESLRTARDLVSAIRLDDLPDHRLIPHLTGTREMLRVAEELVEALNLAARTGGTAHTTYATTFADIAASIHRQALEVRRIDHSASGLFYRLFVPRPS